MKVRTDFVTNSSSSSFTLVIRFDLKDGTFLQFEGAGATGETGPTEYFDREVVVKVSPKQLGTAKSVDELIELLAEGIVNAEGYCLDMEKEEEYFSPETPIFDKSRPRKVDYSDKIYDAYDFVLDIREKVKSMDQISNVTILCDEENYDSHIELYEYDCTTGNYTGKVKGEYMQENGSSGGYIQLSDRECKIDCLDGMEIKVEMGNDGINIVDKNRRIERKVFILGNYPQGKNGKIKPIEWEILKEEDNKILVISKYGLDCKKYNEEFDGITWETCTLRKWLNNDFIDRAFTKEEQSKIVSTKVTAEKNPIYDTDPGKDTEDKVFLLSILEAKEYFKSNDNKKCKPTEYAKANGAYTDDESGNTFWWLRSPGDYQNTAASVDNSGDINGFGDDVGNGRNAVRPALWINLES